MKKTDPKVDIFLRKATKWKKEFAKLRQIALDSGLTEELKWRLPCYTFQEGNVAIIQGFRDYCALMFFKGALLRDPKRNSSRTGKHAGGAADPVRQRSGDRGDGTRREEPISVKPLMWKRRA